ncbi:bifunctional metallophosphatase/5'-nucleotidase [Nonomuraea sp. FMUSA5-5]|uniref:Bifunctional metallophosphatase/5'-nucleotidase n=1 Tax=Nonomuraea composti TaxID=2720023 RepID=A0ABX1B1A2_9ACTN|nr:bifunctional metallophosphatase/5'-nucleotidase [Nonomuraea sp. FMUSA5-5]
MLDGVVATVDVHSSFDRPTPMLAHLQAARRRALVVDAGDFFEGSGYYRLGGGAIERHVLLSLYDVLAPGNHGWRHHFEPDLRALTVCANAVDTTTGEPLFRTVRIERIGGRRVAVTAVIGMDAFATIPLAERIGHGVIRPELALQELYQRHRDAVDDWIVLSHTGFDHDLALATACPFVSVIFSGHCHSPQYGPARVRDSVVLKGPELGEGYAQVVRQDGGWAAHTSRFPEGIIVAPPVSALVAQLDAMRERLLQPIGLLSAPFRDAVLDRRRVLTLIATWLGSCHAAEAVLLNDTSLRPVHLGKVLREGDLMAIEPFANELVRAHLVTADLGTLSVQVGPLLVYPGPDMPRCAWTTRYLADTFLGGRWNGPPLALAPIVRTILTGQEGDAS